MKKLLPLTISLLNPKNSTQELMICTAQFLNVITEENEECKSLLTNESTLIFQANMANLKHTALFRNLCASVLCNLASSNNLPSVFKMILPIIITSLDYDGFDHCTKTLEPLIDQIVGVYSQIVLSFSCDPILH